MSDAVSKYKKRRRKRLEERYDGLFDWITLKNGVHVPIKDGKAVGGPIKGENVSSGKKMGEKRGQIGKGGRVKGADLTAFNKEALESIKEETGYSDKDAKKLHSAMTSYFGGEYKAFTAGQRQEQAKIIDEGLSRMGAYDGPIYRGMNFNTEEKAKRFEELDEGDELTMKSISSWTSDENIARNFAGMEWPSTKSMVMVCNNNKSGVGVQHISRFRDEEAEVLAPSTGKWKVKKKTVLPKDVAVQQMLDSYEGKDMSEKERSMYNFLKNQMQINRHVFAKGKYIMFEVEEI